MNDIPDFADALIQFQRFLADSGHPTAVFWVFREDVWKLSAFGCLGQISVISGKRYSPEKVFAEGRERGLVDVHAVAIAADKIAATVWFPKFAHKDQRTAPNIFACGSGCAMESFIP